MAPLAPLIDRMRDLAIEGLPGQRTCKIRLWDDGTFDVVIYHGLGNDEMEYVSYDITTGEVAWNYRKNGEWVVDDDAEDGDGYGTSYIQEFEASESRRITTIEPPVELSNSNETY
jgi:hypothetical protein